MDEQRPREKASPTQARQGRLGMPILYILLASLAFAVIVWFAVGTFGEQTDPEAGSPVTVEESDAGQADVDTEEPTSAQTVQEQSEETTSD